MRIRSYQIYSIDDLYTQYRAAYDRQEIFDAFTLSVSVYVDAGILLSINEFKNLCKRTKINVYSECASYAQYKKLQHNHINAVLKDKTVLTIFTDYNEREFITASEGGFIQADKKTVERGMPETIFNSNMIENINVSLKDTKTILSGGKTINVKYDDELSVINAKDAFDLRAAIKGFVTSPYYICKLHYELMKGLRDDAGQFRTYQVYIGSASHVFPAYDNVPHLMERLEALKSDDITMEASLIHASFINIHPFGDGNGRIGRLITHPHTNIPFEHRLEYYMALDAYGKYQSIYPLYTLLRSLDA
jgi:hypothetical protein